MKKLLLFLSKVGAVILRVISKIYKHGCEEVKEMRGKAKLFTKKDFMTIFKGQASYFFLAAALTQTPAAWQKTLAWLNLPYSECVEKSEDGLEILPVRAASRFLISTYSHVFNM